VARLDSREIRIQIRQGQADLDRARSRLLQAQEEIDFHQERQSEEIVLAEATLRGYRHKLEEARAHAERSNQDFKRARELFTRQLISRQRKDHAEAEVRQAKAQVLSMEEKIKEGEATLRLIQIRGREVGIKKAVHQGRQAEVSRAEENLADLRHRLELMTIRSPVHGKVAKTSAHRGELVQPGQPIFLVLHFVHSWVEANVEETKIRFVKPGAKAIIRVDSYPGHSPSFLPPSSPECL
jgi:membrane fusion protein (multidrug efflux system)